MSDISFLCENLSHLQPENVGSRHKYKDTPLHKAVMSKNLNLCKQLLSDGCDINAQNMFGLTPLHVSLYQKEDSISETLIEAAADVNLKDFNGKTSLDLVLNTNSSAYIIRKLLDKMIDIDESNDTDASPMFSAVCHESNDTVTQMLLDKGFRANPINSKGQTPLHRINADTKRETIVLLLDNQVELDKKDAGGCTALIQAVKCSNVPVVDLLLRRGSDVNCQDSSGKTSLHYACMGKNLQLLKKLLLKRNNTNIDLADNEGDTALLQAVKVSDGQDAAVIDLLLQKGSSINCQDSKGNSPVHIACKYRYNELLKRLLHEKNCNINLKDVDGNTPLILVTKKNRYENINLLLKSGADVNVCNRVGSTPLHKAVYLGFRPSVEVLLGAGGRLNITDNMGQTPLDVPPWRNPRKAMLIRQLIFEHMVKLNCANLEVGVEMENDVLTKYEEFRKKCLEELERLKRKMFGEVSLFILFTYSDRQIPTLTGNLEMDRFMNSKHLNTEFPIYSCILEFKFCYMKERNSLLNLMTSVIFYTRIKKDDSYRDICVPDVPKMLILSYLTKEELVNLKNAYINDTVN